MAPSPCRRLPRLLRQQVAWAALRLPRRYPPGRWHLVPSPTLRARPLYRCPPPARQALPRDNARGRVVRYPGAQLGAGAGGSGGPLRAPRERAGVTPAAGARAVSEGRGGACRAPPPSPAAGARRDRVPARAGDSTSFPGFLREAGQPAGRGHHGRRHRHRPGHMNVCACWARGRFGQVGEVR